MGIGVVAGDRLKMLVVARHQLTPAEWAQWKRAIQKASDLLFDATQGQLQIGDVYFADDDNGASSADMLLYASGDPSFARGRFGMVNGAVHIMPYVKEKVLTFLHEWGHLMWGLGEEYSQPVTSHAIDTSSPAPDKKTIPILASGLATDQLVAEQADALLQIGDQIERHAVAANTATSITVADDFSVLPTDADVATTWIQRPAACAEDADADFCIMENSRGAAGTLAPDGTWDPAANPVTEFCTNSNHDPQGETDQDVDHNRSCWETIVTVNGFTGLTAPDPAAPGPAAGADPVNFYVLDPDPRFAVVLDRSGSMEEGNKLPDAKHGAQYWIEFCAVAGDKLTVVWYDHDQQVLLPLTEVDSLTDDQLEQLVADVNALTPGGSTGIRDALLKALTEISSPPTRAATQVAVLLTDGIHNSPLFSSAQEAVPTLRENGVRVYALGVGEPNEVDMDTLDDIADGTGGRSYAVGTNQPNTIETRLVEINAEVRGGMIASIPSSLPDAGGSDADRRLRPVVSGKKERPPFASVAKWFGITIEESGEVRVERKDRVSTTRMFVENGADRASFTLLHPEGNPVWLYLVDPTGTPVELGDPGHAHVRSEAPHEFSVVAGPQSGWWTLVLVRPLPGSGFPVRVVGGVEHKRLDVFAHVPTAAEHGDVVEVVAGANYGLPLTGLRVRARLRAPSGDRVSFALSDRDARGEATGTYRGSMQLAEAGRYEGVVLIESTPTSTDAMRLTRALHLEEGGQLDPRPVVPLFRRELPVQFLVRRRGTKVVPDKRDERDAGRGSVGWVRPTKLKSAPFPKRR